MSEPERSESTSIWAAPLRKVAELEVAPTSTVSLCQSVGYSQANDRSFATKTAKVWGAVVRGGLTAFMANSSPLITVTTQTDDRPMARGQGFRGASFTRNLRTHS